MPTAGVHHAEPDVVATANLRVPPTIVCALLLVVLAVPLFFIQIGRPALVDPDEPYYAVPALEMVRADAWAVPLFRGEPWLDKPPLYYWAVIAAFHILGVNETAARFPSALAGLLCAAAIFLLGPRRGAGGETSWLAAIILASSLEFALLARTAVTDMMLTLLLTVGMLAVARYLASTRAAWAALAGLAFGFAALTKGPVGIIVPGLALAGYALAARRSDLLRPRALAAAIAGFLVAAAPWYIFMARAHPELLFDSFLRDGNMGRFLHAERASFPFFYVAVFAAGFLPWSGSLPGAFATALRPSTWRAERGPGRPTGSLFTLCWFGGAMLPFVLSASKLASYALPAFVPAAILTAGAWASAFGSSGAPFPKHRFGPRAAGIISVTLSLIIAAGLVVVARNPRWSAASMGISILAVVLPCGTLLALRAIELRSLRGTVTAYGLTTVGCMLSLSLFVLPQLEPLHSTRPLVDSLRAAGVSQSVAGAFDVHDVSLDYYLGRPLPRVADGPELLRKVSAEPGRLWIVRTEDLPRLNRELELTVEPLFRGPNRCAVRLSPRAAGSKEAS